MTLKTNISDELNFYKVLMCLFSAKLTFSYVRLNVEVIHWFQCYFWFNVVSERNFKKLIAGVSKMAYNPDQGRS